MLINFIHQLLQSIWYLTAAIDVKSSILARILLNDFEKYE